MELGASAFIPVIFVPGFLWFRTYYDGKQMISRLGNPFTPPKWLLDSGYPDYRVVIAKVSALELPNDVTLDGELFGGRGEFQSTVSIVKTMNSPHWQGITFQVRLAFYLGCILILLVYARFSIYPLEATIRSKIV